MGSKFDKVWALARIALGFEFFWAFIDKAFGLGFSTCVDPKTQKFIGIMCDKGAWLHGGSPTFGFLKFGTKGPLVGIFQSLATSHTVEWLFMLGLLGIGLALLLGIATRLASVSAILMLFFMYLSMLWPANNPILDEHIIYIIIMFGFLAYDPGKTCGLGKWWANLAPVKRCKILQ